MYVDALKFAGGSFALMPGAALAAFIDVCHRHDVLVSTGGFIEYVLGQGAEEVDAYITEAKGVGFDIIEFVVRVHHAWLRLAERVTNAGLKAKPELRIQFGAGGASATKELEAEGTRDTRWLIAQARRFLDAGAYMIMIESKGISESVAEWRTDAPSAIASELGLERIMLRPLTPMSSRGRSNSTVPT